MAEQYSYKGRIESQDAELWTSTGMLDVRDQAVDLVIETRHTSFQYETHCFETISSTLKENEFAIGPHLVDFLLMKEGWESMIRPDGFIFTAEKDFWWLSTLIEVKTGKYAINRKLRGFSTLLEQFRVHSGFLPSILKETLGEIYETPKHIFIPENQNIHVIFAGPSEKNLDAHGHGQLFHLRNMKINFQ